MKPNFAEVHNNLGVVFQELNRLAEAEVSYKRAITLKYNYPEAHSNLGNTLKAIGKLREAEASYTKAIILEPNFAEAHSQLGMTLKKLGKLEAAVASLKKAVNLRPNFTEAYNNLGVILKSIGKLEEAEASYNKAIVSNPDFVEVYNNLGNTLKELGKLEEAKASFLKAITLKPNYQSAQHMLNALTGKKTKTAPREYIEGLFDNYAANFENSLKYNLKYKIPISITEIIMKYNKFDSLGSIVDLGCGTGLLGVEIKTMCRYLEGVDLSENMLDKAREKNLYNKLVKQDIINYLSNMSSSFDYFIATDVFIYIGDLSEVFRLIKTRNKTSGKFAFSTEHRDGNDFFLEQTGRFSHSKKYIESLCKKFDYKIQHFETQPLRKEKNKYITGGIYLLDF